jgi:2-polyprenyl-3-methyl-5-hydroxy-6-metoxy-1,4-benzoquinol methylase
MSRELEPMEAYYDGFYRELSAIDALSNGFSKIEELLPNLPPKARVLDIGCGHGTVSSALVEGGFEVVGLEANQEALESSRRKGIIGIKCDIGRKIELEPDFDLVLLLDVLEHVFNPLFLLEEAVRMLRPGGSLILSVPLYFDLADRLRILFTGSVLSYDNRCYGSSLCERFRSYNYDHIRFFRPADIAELCGLAGLEVEKIAYQPMRLSGWLSPLARVVSNRWTAGLFPGLLAHGMKVRARK